MNGSQLDALLLLSLVPGLGPTLTRRCLEAAGSAEAVLDWPAAQFARVDGIGGGGASEIRKAIDRLLRDGELAREKEAIERAGTTVIAGDDPAYPALLRHIPDPPPLLYVRGQLTAQDAVALAVVGSRRCSHYGREQADRLSALGAGAGLTIVSGGAYGIDAAAHRAALRVKGRTIAVLGSGLGNPYPSDHAGLFDEIAAGQGAVISEHAMTAPPVAQNFPRRNRIISGLSLGVLVVEAAVRSGALITARLAAEEHGRAVMALPGRIDSATSGGCHKLIRQGGATLVTSLPEILEELGEAGSLLGVSATDLGDVAVNSPAKGAGQRSLFELNLSDSQKRIVDALAEPCSLDQLVAQTGMHVAAIQADLTMLEIRGLIARRSGMYSRKR
ncbi:MAG: DNA-processing protein DprA [Phycisphaeraceae bacterium]